MHDFDGVTVETETTGPVKSDASTAEKEEMKKPQVDQRESAVCV